MKKTIYAFIITAALTVSSAANAIVNSNLTQNQTTNQTVQTEFKKVCEVCPYADETMCRNWTPDCPADTKFDLIDPVVLKTCPSNCTLCNKITGKCTTCATGYAVNTAGNCTREFVPINPDLPVIDNPVIIPTTTATVSSCPSGTTKSSDGCCCVNN